MESLGVLVHHPEISLAVVDNFFGGPVLITWRKLRRYVEEDRVCLGRDTIHEWFQWLAERLSEREAAAPAVPAYVAERDWQP